MKPFLILQLRPLDAAADAEFEAFLKYGGLKKQEVERVRMEADSIATITANDYAAIIVGGGPSNVSDELSEQPEYQLRFEKELHDLLDQITAQDIPFLGSCYGLGILAHHLGGQIARDRYSEPVGQVEIFLTAEGQSDDLLHGLPFRFLALVGHKEAVQFAPKGCHLLGSSATCPVQILRYRKNIYATQFHPELDVPGIIERIKYYKHHGYFAPEDAETLMDQVANADVTVPQQILRRFVDRYR